MHTHTRVHIGVLGVCDVCDMHVYICTWVCAFIPLCIYIYIVCVCVCVCVYVYVCVYVCVCVCVCTCVCLGLCYKTDLIGKHIDFPLSMMWKEL